MAKLIFFLALLLCALAFAISKFFGASKLDKEALVDVDGFVAAKRLLRGSGIEVEQKKSWWAALNPLKDDILYLGEAMAQSHKAMDVAQVMQTCGLALLEKAHPASVKQRYRAVKFASLFPAFIWVLVILMMAVRRLPPSMALALAAVGLALSCVALLVNVAVEREAARRAITAMEKNGVLKRMSQQEMLEEMIMGRAHLNLFPTMFHGMMIPRKTASSED